MRRAERGDLIGGFEALAMPHLNDLYRAAVSLLGDSDSAAEAVQDSILLAWKSYSAGTAAEVLRLGLFTNLFQVISRRRSPAAPFSIRPDIPGEDDVLPALRQLPLQYAVVVLLADVYEMRFAEIQEVLGIPTAVVAARLSQGRELLRTHLPGVGFIGGGSPAEQQLSAAP